MQFINSGNTRLVVLAGPFAFKIAKIRLRYPLQRAIDICKAKKASEKFAEWRRERDQGIASVIVRAVFGGIYANLAERRRFLEHPDAELVPTLLTFGGLVNVQKRGNNIDDLAINSHPLLRSITVSTVLGQDLSRPEQYCTIDGKLLLADYGNPYLEIVLRNWAKPI